MVWGSLLQRKNSISTRKSLIHFAFRCQSPMFLSIHLERHSVSTDDSRVVNSLLSGNSLRTEIPHSAMQTSSWSHSPWEENGLVVIFKGSHMLSIIALCLCFKTKSQKHVEVVIVVLLVNIRVLINSQFLTGIRFR